MYVLNEIAYRSQKILVNIWLTKKWRFSPRNAIWTFGTFWSLDQLSIKVFMNHFGQKCLLKNIGYNWHWHHALFLFLFFFYIFPISRTMSSSSLHGIYELIYTFSLRNSHFPGIFLADHFYIIEAFTLFTIGNFDNMAFIS
jgi:hypothetical protein